MKLSLEELDNHIESCREAVESGNESPTALQELLDLRMRLQDASASDWEDYDLITQHLPPNDQDPVLIVLKGQLLIEGLVWRFILSRLPNPSVLKRRSFNTDQCISMAESFCLANEEPNWLWKQVRELNAIRNKYAHSLVPEHIGTRINNFVSTIDNENPLKNRNLAGAVAYLYGMVKGLCDLTETEEFKLRLK